jgi:hypothetical protein
MRDAKEVVVYVGKAKNLRKRLGSYRVADPDRMPRRHLRMLRAVKRVELQHCLDESAALARESELLRALRPKYNRAGTWPGKPRYLAWRLIKEQLELRVSELIEAEWHSAGPLGSMAVYLRNALARLLWCSIYTTLGPSRMPAGWIHGRFESITRIAAGACSAEVHRALMQLFSVQPERFVEWMRAKTPNEPRPFDRAAIETDLEFLTECFPKWKNGSIRTVATASD